MSGSGARNCGSSLVGDDDRLPGLRDRRCCERGESSSGRADACVPLRADRRERAPERGLETAVQPLDSAGLEVRDPERGGIDGEAGVLERTHDLLPRELGAGRVGLDERERRTRGERLPQPHPRLHACGLGGRRHRPDQRLPLRNGGKCRRAQRESRRPPECRLQLEPWDG